MGCMNIFMRPVTGDWVTFNNFAFSGSMPQGNNYGSLNMNARDMVCIWKDWQWQCQYFWDIKQVCSMHIMGFMTISMRHVTGDWVTFNDFASPGNMPHGNNYGSLNMHVRDIVCIPRDLQWPWKYFEITKKSVACILWDVWPFPWGMSPAIGSYSTIFNNYASWKQPWLL